MRLLVLNLWISMSCCTKQVSILDGSIWLLNLYINAPGDVCVAQLVFALRSCRCRYCSPRQITLARTHTGQHVEARTNTHTRTYPTGKVTGHTQLDPHDNDSMSGWRSLSKAVIYTRPIKIIVGGATNVIVF